MIDAAANASAADSGRGAFVVSNRGLVLPSRLVHRGQ